MRKPAIIEFTKMHGLGNDFIVINSMKQTLPLTSIPIQQLSHRYTGIGFDQLLWIGDSKKADISCLFFNADGSEAEQCGNGIRCVARYAHENKLVDKNEFTIETKAGVVKVTIHDYQHIKAELTIPTFSTDQEIAIDDDHGTYNMFVLSMGNPHVIIQVPSIEQFPVGVVGQKIATHHTFADGTNVGFMEILHPHHIRLRTYERGVGETLACGSNACAAVAAGIMNKLLVNQVTVELALGDLQIEWQGENMPVVMTGPAEVVFEGCVSLGNESYGGHG